jgi:hypothetical protein
MRPKSLIKAMEEQAAAENGNAAHNGDARGANGDAAGGKESNGKRQRKQRTPQAAVSGSAGNS